MRAEREGYFHLLLALCAVKTRITSATRISAPQQDWPVALAVCALYLK